MGYTHFMHSEKWTDEDSDGFKKALPTIRDILKVYKDLVQRDCDIPEEPEVTDELIAFNGIDDEGHETFWFKNESNSFSFCKTASKPYDIVVCEVLLILDSYIPSLEIKSDGNIPGRGDKCDDIWITAAKNVSERYGIDDYLESTTVVE